MISILDEQRCYELLTATTVGRIGFVHDDVVQILPVNFVVAGHDLLVRTSPDGILGSLAKDGPTVAFEVDHHESLARSAWSVLMHGSLTHASAEEAAALTARVLPWAGGQRDLPLRFRIASMTGRAVKHTSS
ncbi:MAG: pyridoxamine 5'-phosphate oxidase family protein [Microbacterium sp.]